MNIHSTLSFLFIGLLAMPLSSGCGEDKDTADTDDGEPQVVPVIEITSPTAGDVFIEGDPVSLAVSIYDENSGNPLTGTDVSWSAAGWAGFTGESGTVTDLPVGALTLSVSATVNGHTLSDGVDITVEQGDVEYTGTFNSTNTWSGYGMDFADICEGDVNFVVEPNGAMSGDGQCVLTVYYPGEQVVFDIVGQVTGGTVNGQMQMNVSGNIYGNPFSGTRAGNDAITVNFDTTYPDVEGGDLRIQGNFAATPRP